MKKQRSPRVVMSQRELGGRHFGLMVCRFAYYVRGVSLVPDVEYDALERAFVAGGGIIGVGSDRAADYHPSVREQADDEILIQEHNAVNHKGERNPNSVLTKQLVREMKRMRALGFSLGWLANWLGVTKSCVQKVCDGTTWRVR